MEIAINHWSFARSHFDHA